MKNRIVIAAGALCGLTCGLTAAAAYATPPAAAPAASPDRLAVSDVMSWTVPNGRTVYVEDAAGDWYRLDLAAPCRPLARAVDIALATPPGGGFRTASAVVTGGGRCAIRAVVPVSAPALPPNRPYAAFGGTIGR
ncbi:MAG: hypothetical protein QOH81_2281 [Sphingomonadales bacterium]|jgi:hypothetical protein|nr:hypothetical protein [Sphingomonadales bacterium]